MVGKIHFAFNWELTGSLVSLPYLKCIINIQNSLSIFIYHNSKIVCFPLNFAFFFIIHVKSKINKFFFNTNYFASVLFLYLLFFYGKWNQFNFTSMLVVVEKATQE